MQRKDASIDDNSSRDISVVIPVAEAPDVFKECLSALFRGSVLPEEVILVDDGMDESAISIARYFPIKIVKNQGKGVAEARNTGALLASSSIILFIDTDVIVQKNTLEFIQNTFKQRNADGVIGIQTAQLRFRNFFSLYKNHWMRFTYRRLKPPIHLFYTSCAAVKKHIFKKSKGFDINYRRPSIEDTVFGADLGEMGAYILADPLIEIEHVKRYDLNSILKTDFTRSSDLVKYILRNKKSSNRVSNTSVPNDFILSVFFMTLFYMALFLGGAMAWGMAYVYSLLCLGGIYLSNINWLTYLFREEGLSFVIKAIIFLPLDLTFVIGGITKGFLDYLAGNVY